MTEHSPFEARPDPALGAELRAALDSPDTAVFVQRVRAALRESAVESTWDVLARWAPRGLVAAAAAAALLWLVVRTTPEPAPSAPIASAPVQMEVSPSQPEAVVLTVALLEGR